MSQGGGSVASSSQVTSKSSSNKWFGLAALAVIGLIGWSLTFGSGGGSASNDEAGIEGAESAEPAPAPDSPVTTTEEVAEDEEMETEEMDEGPADTADPGAPVGVASMPDEEDLSNLTLLDEAGEPVVLAEPVGYALLVVSGHGPSSVVDLDSQRLVELPEVRGDIALTTASHIVLASGSGPVRSASFADLGAELVELDSLNDWPQLSVGPDPDQAWALTYGEEDGSQTRTLVDLKTGEAIRSYPVVVSFSPIGQGPIDLVNVIGGGVFEETSEGHYRRFANGWAVAATGELVLVRRCSSDLTCTGLWLDRASGATLDYPSPDLQSTEWWGAGIDSSNNWYWTRDPRQGTEGVRLTHIRTGREIELSGIESWPGPSVSPDGRWVTYLDHRLGQLALVNLETERIYHVVDAFRGNQVIFVPLESFDSLAE